MFNIELPPSADDYYIKDDFISNFWRDTFKESHRLKVSDIHIEPQQHSIRVRGRKNGKLLVINELESNLLDQKMYFDRLKLIAKFDTHTTGKRQDREVELKSNNSRYRLSLLPSQYGEKIVIRVIENSNIPKLEDLNLDQKTFEDIVWSINQKQGFICITGPTGSGKSTTLQAMILELDRLTKNVVALEDPVERHLENVTHIQITEKLSWKDAIKGVMRADPDVIIIGEIRDEESATLAFEAAQTGHLVLSTLHTNDVPGTIDRLIGLGVERHLMAENLLFVAAQRLVPKLCPDCKIKDEKFYRSGNGCNKCNDLNGIIGRIPVLEYSLKPSPSSILNFNRDLFKKNELKKDLLTECKNLFHEGMIDKTELIGRGLYEKSR